MTSPVIVESVVAGGNILWQPSSCREAGVCGRCEEFCPTGVLDLGRGPGQGSDLPGALCTRCRLCLFVCPAGALSLRPLGNLFGGVSSSLYL
ncbi:MAG: 4Fe-4S dicluster domain-containing protein [Leptospirillia bacterium]